MQFEFIFRFAVNWVNLYETVLCLLLLLFIIYLHFVFSPFLTSQMNTLKGFISWKVQIFLRSHRFLNIISIFYLFISEYKVIVIVNNYMNALYGRQ